jgi:hypothetical protein
MRGSLVSSSTRAREEDRVEARQRVEDGRSRDRVAVDDTFRHYELRLRRRRRVAVVGLSRQSRNFLVSLCVGTRASEFSCVEARRLLCFSIQEVMDL